MNQQKNFPTHQSSLVAFSAELSVGTRHGKHSRIIEWTRRLLRTKHLLRPHGAN